MAVVVQERDVLKRRGPVPAFPQGGDSTYTIAADQDCVVGKREQLTRGLSPANP